MSAQPRCKKCGRPLTDPTSQAIGLGPECRGSGAGRGHGITSRRRKAQAARRSRSECFASGQPVIIGNTKFEKRGDVWIDQRGRALGELKFRNWLKTFGLID